MSKTLERQLLADKRYRESLKYNGKKLYRKVIKIDWEPILNDLILELKGKKDDDY